MQAITDYLVASVSPGDVLLTFTRSQVVEAAILAAHAKGPDFRVIIVDGAPRYEGRVTLDPLLAAGVRCTYAHLHALSYLMPEVTKVLLGAASMLLNGTLVSRAGSALVAMAASERGIPVLVCCETYKFAERVLLDSICYNELGDPDDLIEPEPHPPLPAAGRRITDWRDIPQLKLLNLLYDVTPTKYLSVVVTEVSALLSLTVPPTRPPGSPRSPQVGIIPPTSVPVVIREDAARAQLPARA